MVALALARPATRRGGAAAGLALVLVDDPSLLGLALFWTAVTSAALLPRRRFRDAVEWAGRLMLHGLLGLWRPLGDFGRVSRVSKGRGARSVRSIAALLALPVAGGAVFTALFADANPLIADALGRIELPSLGRTIGHAVLWGLVLLAVWPSFRPAPRATGALAGPDIASHRPEIPPATLLLSLLTFNAIFAVQNGLDLAFLWSGAALPDGVTMADYAHRGAYPLIATALLAGSFVLVALRPGSAGARSPWARRLVVLWVAQNLLLVGSSMSRTVDYVQAYSLTVLRLAALLWMALVAAGLALICWRLIAGRSARWLVNANALAGGAVLAAASVVDLGATAAAWNVRHARELTPAGAPLDLCYLNRLGPSALLRLAELEAGTRMSPPLHDRVAAVLAGTLRDVEVRQANWRRWTWRDARRLSAARAALAGRALRAPVARRCDGSPVPPPARPAAPPMLTPEPRS